MTHDKAKQLRIRHDELTLALDDEPTAPEPATLTAVADHITEIITSGTHNQTKALVEALVAKVTITGPDRLIPVFRIPQPRNNDGAAPALPAETAPNGVVRTMTKSVGVVEHFSHLSRPVKRLLDIALTWPNSVPVTPPAPASYKLARQLRPAEVDQLVADYQSGATVFELAARFNVHRNTIGKYLNARGIDTRPPALDADDLPKLIQLYQDGHSIAAIAERYGVSKNAVRNRLLATGLVLRPRGWPNKRVANTDA